MKDKIIRATAKNGAVRIFAASSTNLVNEGAKIHNCSPTAAAALGRMLTAGALMGVMLKSEKDTLTLQINGGGEAKGVVVTSYHDGRVKGYIGNPGVHLEANDKGKLDVGGAIGKNGLLSVIRDMGLKDPYVGQVPIYSGEIAEDLAYYFTVSEQTPSAVALGVYMNKEDMSVQFSGGLIIQLMPDTDPMLADIITYRLEDMVSITDMMLKGNTIDDIVNFLFDDMDLDIKEEIEPYYGCDCSREKVEKAFISIGKKDLTEIYNEGKEEELKCHFCNTGYIFTNEDVGNILNTL